MTTEEVQKLFAFNRWANLQFLEALGELDPAEFAREMGGSFGSIRMTVLHLMFGERVWLRFWQDGSIIQQPPESEYPDLQAIERAWTDIDNERNTFARTLTQELLDAPRTVHDQDFSLAELIQHIVNHSTYHRGQLALYLRQLGRTPPATDYRLYLSDTR